MSSYNSIEKIKYTADGGVVTLREYIVFTDELAEEKYVVFKFANNVSQQLLGMEFEVSQYDVDGALLEKSVVIYNKFLAKPNKTFVPKAKLKVNYALKTLSVRLVQAAYDRFIWKEGEFLDNSYKFEHYAQSGFVAQTEPAPLPAPKQKAPVYDVYYDSADSAPKRKKGALPFVVKNTTRKNIAKFPGVFNFLVCIIVLAALAFSVYYFTTHSTAFSIDGYDLRLIDKEEKTVAVTGYDGVETDIVIPAELGEYTVVRIYENAFKNSHIESVTFASSIYIESYAFEGCENLKSVTSYGQLTMGRDAFKDCPNLDTENLTSSSRSN